MGGKPDTPKAPDVIYPDALPPSPQRSDAETQSLADEQRKRFSRGGRGTTMLTGGRGSDALGGSSAMRFLGGGGKI